MKTGNVLSKSDIFDVNNIQVEKRDGTTNISLANQAIKNGFAKAFSTIIDANITTLLVAVILYSIGTGPIKGFATVLFWGIIVSMFTAIIVTRFVFDFITSRKNIEKLSI